ncbi:MAG: ArsB/NhaD family transporter [Coriobacteriia bacterium]|nr:ArsB/NhaD family transporter [Coriobacteriia bacterium]MDR2714509.1 ArsB/NhaD family transporter [Coriobacteriales bacterium]
MSVVQVASIVIFAGVMVLIVSEVVHRTLAALFGAVIVLASGILPFEASLHHIDFNTIGVLVGMMLFVAVAKRSGLFEYIAIKAAKLAKGDPWRIMVSLSIITAVLSAFLDNVTTVLLIGPMIFMICRELHLNPVPFIITQIIASNIGGTATLIGDPPNIMIGSQAGLSFLDFILVDGPIAVAILLVTLVCFRFIFKKTLVASPENMAAIMELDESEAIISKSLFIKSIVMIVLVAVAFMLHGFLHLESAVIALAAATVMIFIGRQDIEETLLDVEWTTIGFFVGLFVVVGAMAETGVIMMLANFLVEATAGKLIVAMLVILVASAVISAILDNIPFTATMIPVLIAMQGSGMDVTPLWWALSLGACLGGNGTLIGASANVVLSGIAGREGYPITFINYLKYGAPLMALSIVIAGIYLVFRFGM